MQGLIAALLLAASQAAVIRPGDKYTLDLSKDSCTTIIVGKDLCGYQPVRRVHLGDAAVLAPSSGTGIATPSSRRRVDGVEVDATIQHERAVKF
jgi:hypothetical protein